MKRILWVLILALTAGLATDARAGGLFLGTKKASETIVFPLHDALDTLGRARKPDSMQVLTYADNGTALAFSDRSTTYPFSAYIDTTKIYGDTTYWFTDQIQDIDGTAGNFLLSICVRLWCQGISTETMATVQVINDSLNTALFATMPAIRDTVNAILDTLQDGSGGITVQLSTAALASVGNRAADSTWAKPFSTAFTGGSMGDSLNNESYVQNMSRVSMDATAADNFETMLDGTGGAVFSLRKLNINNTTTDDTAIVARGNGVAPGAVFIAGATGPYGIGGRGVGTSAAGIAGIGGTGASAAGIYAYGGGAGDGIQASGGTTGDGIQATGGSSSGNGITVTSTTATPAFNIAGSLTGAGLSIEGFPAMSVRGADGSGANGLVLVGDSTGNGLNVSSEQGDAGRFSAGTAGSFNAHGFRTVGDGTGHGIYSQGGASAGDGMNLEKGSGGQDLDADLGLKDSAYVAAAQAIFDSTATVVTVSRASADSVWNKSFGTSFTAGSMGDSANNSSWIWGIADNGITAAKIAADAIGASELAADAIGSSELATTAVDELVDAVWDEDTTGHYTAPNMAWAASQTGSSTGLDSAATSRIIKRTVWGVGVGSGADSTTQAQRTVTASAVVDSNVVYRQAARAIFDSTATVTVVSKASADSTWNKAFGTSFTAGSMGDSANNASWIQNVATFSANSLTSTALATSAADEIADEVWDEDTTGHDISGSFGRVNNGNRWATIPQVVDSVWNEDTTGHYTTTDMGYHASQTAAISTAVMAAIADSVWQKAFSTAWAAGSMGDSLTNASYVNVVSAVQRDSLLNAVRDATLGLKIFNIGFAAGFTAGSIGDSLNNSTYINGTVAGVSGNVTGSVASVTNPVTVGTLNANTITASALANDAGDEIADQVWDEAQAGHVTDGTFGYNLDVPISTRSTYAGLSAADSGLVSRLIGRKGWGVQQGSGNDSTTVAQRTITASGSLTVSGSDIIAIAKASADSVWGTSFSDAGAQAGSIGDSLNNSSYVGGGGGCAGNGMYTQTFTLKDTSAVPTDSVLGNQTLTVNNLAQNGQTYTYTTGNDGKAYFNLDPGTYVIGTDAAGYAFELDTFTVSGVASRQVSLYKNVGDRKPISFRFDDPSGSPTREFSVSLQLVMVNDSLPRLGDTALTSNAGEVIRLTDLDRDGRINWHLLQNPRITNDSSYYVATFYRKNGSKLRGPEKFRVPTGTTTSEYYSLTRWY